MIRASNTRRLFLKMPTEFQPIPVSAESLRRGHESRNPPAGWIALAAALVLIMMAGSLAIVWAMLDRWTMTRPLDPSIVVRGTIIAPGLEPLQRFPKPNLQIHPHDDLVALQAREDSELHSYGWADRKAGVVRIPIDRAMELIAERGLPTRGTNRPARTGKSEFELARERLLQK